MADGTWVVAHAPDRVSEEAELLRAVADQHVLGLLVVVEHHAMCLPPDAGLLVAAEGRVGRIGVVAIGPDAPGLYCAAEAVGAVDIAGPNASAQSIGRVVGDGQRLRIVLEGRYGQNGAEDLLLEDAHAIVAVENGGLHVIAARQFARHRAAPAARQELGTLPPADVDIAEDLLQLL